jgi:hypothetical protein
MLATDAEWWVTVERSRDHRVGKIEASERVHLRNFEGIAYIKIRK